MAFVPKLKIISVSVCLLATGLLCLAEGAQLGTMQADKILFLGNSITFCPQPRDSLEWWGLSASDPAHDYAHLLVQKINSDTGGSLAIVPPDPPQGEPGERWYPTDPLPNYTGNIINVCDIFEQNFDTWDNARIQNQLDGQPNIVVIQFGENLNLQGGTLGQLENALDAVLTGLKNSSNPYIFITGYILGSNSDVDDIKRDLCAADPEHRVFVNLGAVGQDPAQFIGAYGHPNDAGMALIADTIYKAMTNHAVPEPSAAVLLSIASVAAAGYAWRMQKRR